VPTERYEENAFPRSIKELARVRVRLAVTCFKSFPKSFSRKRFFGQHAVDKIGVLFDWHAQYFKKTLFKKERARVRARPTVTCFVFLENCFPENAILGSTP